MNNCYVFIIYNLNTLLLTHYFDFIFLKVIIKLILCIIAKLFSLLIKNRIHITTSCINNAKNLNLLVRRKSLPEKKVTTIKFNKAKWKPRQSVLFCTLFTFLLTVNTSCSLKFTGICYKFEYFSYAYLEAEKIYLSSLYKPRRT